MDDPKTTKNEKAIPKLTKRQASVLVFIAVYIEKDGMSRSPAYKDIAANFSIAKSTAFQHVEALAAKKCVSPITSSGITITDEGHRAVTVWRKKTGVDDEDEDDEQGFDVDLREGRLKRQRKRDKQCEQAAIEAEESREGDPGIGVPTI